MSRILRDYRCSLCEYVYESFDEDPTCKHCGVRHCGELLLSAPKIAYMRMGADPDFPTAAEKWANAHKTPAQSND